MATALLSRSEPEAGVTPVGPARTTNVHFVDLPEREYLAIDGAGAPATRAFQGAIAALYAVAYTLHFSLKRRGLEPTMGHLEGLWERVDGTDVTAAMASPTEDPATWRWTLLIGLPDGATGDDVTAAIVAASRRKPELAVHRVRHILLEEGTAVEALHTGPYSTEIATIRRMMQAAQAVGLEPIGPHHEIYLGDPRRAAPERLRTILRHSVRVAS
jgi:hypothetical protein